MKRRTLDIGTSTEQRLVRFPCDIANRRLAVFGISGSGKSNTATVVVEGLLACGEQVVLLDPKGEGWGLRVGSDGDSLGGKDVIVFGEPRGDLPLKVEHAEHVAEFVVNSGRSVVLSMLGFETDSDERRFVARFFKRLYKLKMKQTPRSRCMVVVEEAHLFVPETGQRSGDQEQVVSAIRKVVRQGRTAGLGCMLVDQRPADVANSILTQAEMLICHQLVHPSDRKALESWVRAWDREGSGKAFLDSMASLDRGQAWVWSPSWLKLFERVNVARRTTLDTGSDADETAAGRAEMSSVDLESLRQQLDQVVEDAKANDPKLLQKRITELERELETTPQADPRAIDTAVATARKDMIEGVRQLIGEWPQRIGHAIEEMEACASEHRALLALFDGAVENSQASAEPRSVRRIVPSRNTRATEPTDFSPTAAQRRILNALYQLEQIGQDNPDLRAVGFLARINPRGGHFSNSIGPLSTHGLIERGSNCASLTAKGRGLADADIAMSSLDDYHANIKGLLKSNAQRRIFDAVASGGGKSMDVDRIGEIAEIDPSGGHFSNSIGPLSTLGLIKRSMGTVTPTSAMYPEGLK